MFVDDWNKECVEVNKTYVLDPVEMAKRIKKKQTYTYIEKLRGVKYPEGYMKTKFPYPGDDDFPDFPNEMNDTKRFWKKLYS